MDSQPHHKRHLSAIFLGTSSGAPGSLTPTALQVATGSTTPGGSGLPSPPATNSTASTAGGSAKRVRKTSFAFATVKSLLTGDKTRMSRDPDDQPFEDEDHTARLSGPSTSSNGSLALGRSHSTTSSGGGMDRVRNLADRNRKVCLFLHFFMIKLMG